MSRLWKLLFALLLSSTLLTLRLVWAQPTPQLKQGDPPVAALIGIAPLNAAGLVTITGSPGAVFPTAQVAIRNLYTGETVFTQAGINGSFSAVIYGPGNTPFWISPARDIPTNVREQLSFVPGGPGVIIYGSFATADTPTTNPTRLVMNGDLDDWSAYPAAQLVSGDPQVYALLNQDALYIGIGGARLVADYANLVISFKAENSQYKLTLDPRLPKAGLLNRELPNAGVVGPAPVAAIQSPAIELRLATVLVNPNNPTMEVVSLESIQFTDKDNQELLNIPVTKPVPRVEEQSSFVYLNSALGDKFTRFSLSGTLAGRASHWQAQGRINQLKLQPGETLAIELDVTMDVPDLPQGLVGLQMIGQLGLQPVSGRDGQPAAGGADSNNGWSSILTPSGMPIINLRSDFVLAEVNVPAAQVIRRGEQLLIPLAFTLELPKDLPAGMYVPLFRGLGRVGDGEVFRWEDPSPLGNGTRATRAAFARLPVVLNIGGVTASRMLWTLFQDSPSNGSRGLLADADRARYGLANRVHFDSPTYILPPVSGSTGRPIAYALEPYLLNQMPNSWDFTNAPLIPFIFPGGRLSARVTHPDGQVDDLGSPPIIQSRLSNDVFDEATLFGRQTPIDGYRLTTLNRAFTEYVFKGYGEHKIELNGTLEDQWGNRYEGGGVYSVLIAEPLYILPGALPGTPYEVGDVFYPGLRLLPGAPADVTITARIFPLDGGSTREYSIKGQANRAGYFYSKDNFRFDAPGEYVIDYEARLTDSEKRLWAGSLRSVGVIANPGGKLIAHGARGLNNYDADQRPAWFSLRQYLSGVADGQPRMNFPYHSGDVVWINDGLDSALNPIIQAQDTNSRYANGLLKSLPNDARLQRRVVESELPLLFAGPADQRFRMALSPQDAATRAYSYINVVRPGLSLRQFVSSDAEDGLPAYWDMDTPYNRQAGAGLTGDRPNDYMFLFGGAVVRNQAADQRDTAIYGALGIVIDADKDTLGPRVYPPYRGEAGGPNGGPLLVVRGEPVNMFFYPTAVTPGQVLKTGEVLAVAGHIAPTLPSLVDVRITSPAGKVRQFTGKANAIGYYYDPAQDFALDEVGIWMVEIQVRHEGGTSAGQIEPPPPTGGILGAQGGRFQVFALEPQSEPLAWNDTRADFGIPAGVPYNFNFQLPGDWQNFDAAYIVATPAYVLEVGRPRISGRSFSYQFNPANLSRVFPNLESTGQGDGPSASDIITLTFVATRTNADGQTEVRSRTFTITHDRLTTHDS